MGLRKGKFRAGKKGFGESKSISPVVRRKTDTLGKISEMQVEVWTLTPSGKMRHPREPVQPLSREKQMTVSRDKR